MGLLDARALDALLAAGCGVCPSKKLLFRTYVDAALPIAGGEPNGRITWVYKGELFLDGVFEVACADCKRVLFHEEACPRCHRAGALASILETNNRLPVPSACPSCGSADLRLIALLPARVLHADRRSEKAKTSTELYDPGFHGVRVECAHCGPVADVGQDCPLCAAPGPIRPRPT